MNLTSIRMVQFLMVLCVLVLCKAQAASDNVAVTGREIAAKWEKAIVRVQIVLKTSMTYDGREMGTREESKEVTGTIVDPSGLTIVSLSEISPEDSYDDDEDYGRRTEVSDIKIRLADGKEVPAKVVLRDKDLDMAFLRPRQKSDSPFDSVNLADSATLQILDNVIVLARLGRVANRALAVSVDSVQAVVDRPRKFYVIDLSSMTDELGGAVFSMNGKLVGVVLLRKGVSTSSYGWNDRMWVVLPASDIAEVAKQAPEDEAKEPEDE